MGLKKFNVPKKKMVIITFLFYRCILLLNWSLQCYFFYIQTCVINMNKI